MITLTVKEFSAWEKNLSKARLVTVKPSVFAGIGAVLFYIALLCLMAYLIKSGKLSSNFIIMSSMGLILILFIFQLFIFRTNLKPNSWVMLVYDDFLVFKPRSILNKKPAVLLNKDILILNSNEVVSINPKSGVNESLMASGGKKVEYYQKLEIVVKQAVVEEVNSFFSLISENLLKAKSKFHHYPVVFSHNMISINWLGTNYAQSPSMNKMIRKIDRLFAVNNWDKAKIIFVDSEEHLKEYLQRGSFIDAVRLVRRHRGCSLVEAVKIVKSATSHTKSS